MALFMQNSVHDWRFRTEPNRHVGLGLNGRRMNWPRGKMLGGSGAMNALLYARGFDRDFDGWQAAGNAGWGWSDVLPFFKRSERNADAQRMSGHFHGFDGLRSVEHYQSTAIDDAMKRLIGDCFAELGFREIDDINANNFTGFVRAQGTLLNGMRHSTARAFLTETRANLHVIKHAHVTRINVDAATKRVRSVAFMRTNERIEMTAPVAKEVVLSAGVIGSPQILMLSGIGPPEQLNRLAIDVTQAANGVGQNLQDHLIVPYILAFHKSTARTAAVDDIATEYFQYLLTRNGLFSNLGSTDYMGFISTGNATKYADVQILNFLLFKRSTATVTLLLNNFNYRPDIVDAIVRANNEADTLLMFVALLNPMSRGTIELNSADPFDAPKIAPNYLQETEDMRTILRAMRLLRRIPSTAAFRRHEGEVVPIDLPECDASGRETDEYWECYVRHMSITLYHPVGTVKMGPDGDRAAVVDHELRVKGIDGLRVADASVMPQIVGANTDAAVVMIGERVVDFIRRNEKSLHRNEL